MAKYVELVGVSGVGKSTTYNFLRTEYFKDARWIPYDMLCRQNIEKGRILTDAVKYYLKKILKPGSVSIPHDKKNLNIYVQDNPLLAESFWRTFSRNGRYYGKDIRFHEVDYVMYLFEKIQKIKNDNGRKYCIVDEGLIHNLNYFTPHTTDPQEVLKVIDIMELPNAVVYFSGSIESIMERTLNREICIERDKDLSPDDILNARLRSIDEKKIFVETVKSKGVPVLELNAADSFKSNSGKIISFIDTL